MARICFITNSIGFGGASKILCFVAESLAERGHSVLIMNLRGTADVSGYERPVSQKIALHHIKSGSRFAQLEEMCGIVKAAGGEIVIGFTEGPNWMARVVGLKLGIPSIMSERGDPERTGVKKGLKGRVALALINGSRGGVFQTEGAREFYGRGLKKRSAVIPNPIFIAGNVPEAGLREKTVVSVGRLDNFQKRYDVMLRAFAIFREAHPEYILKLYGRGTDEAQIRQWAEGMGLGESVRFMGLTTQPMQDIVNDGMFLITSDFEGIPNALLEAMAVGLPCVATDCTPGGARLLITDHENGLIAPVGDPQAIAAAMRAYAEDALLAEKCGNRARAVVTRFAPGQIADRWEEYIIRIIGGKKG